MSKPLKSTLLAAQLKQSQAKREPLAVAASRTVKRAKSAPVPLALLEAEDDDDEDDEDFDPDAEGDSDDDESGEEGDEGQEAEGNDDFIEGDVGDDGSEALRSDSGDEMVDDIDEDEIDDLEPGEEHMEMLFTDKGLEEEDLGEFDTHNLEKEREYRTDQHDRSITKTEHEVSCLFYDILSRYALAKRDDIIKGKITDALSADDLRELAKAMGVSLSFRRKLEAIKKSITAIIFKEPNTILTKIFTKMASATGWRITPLDGILQLCPALGEPKHEGIRADVVTQEKILANKGVLLHLREESGAVNMVMTKQTLSFALAIYFITHFELIVGAECCRFMDEILARDRDIMPEAIITRYIHEDAKQIIPMYSNYFRRQLKRLAISFPGLEIPKSIQADLAK